MTRYLVALAVVLWAAAPCAHAVDAIVLGEVRRGVWMPGSDLFNRTERNQQAWPQETSCAMTGIAIVYEGRAVRLYRNGAQASEYQVNAP